ncbi:MAG: MIP/aquaporin family protein [Cyclobacteriaceae bacterium]|nr:MIP/aquaporin family protein [Cyclobacteriaceae bacterium]
MNPYVAEFIGTAILICFGGGVVAGAVLKNSNAFNSGWITICTSWGLGVTFAIYAVGNVSSAHLNPAVTLGLAIVDKFPWNDVPGYIIGQILGAMTGATIVWIFYKAHWKKTESQASKLGIFCTAPAERSFPNNFVDELIATFLLMFGLSFIGANNFADGLNPLVIGDSGHGYRILLWRYHRICNQPSPGFSDQGSCMLCSLIEGKGGSDWAYSWGFRS